MIIDMIINQKIKLHKYIFFTSIPVIIYQFFLFFVHGDSSYASFLLALILTYIIYCYGVTFIGLRVIANSFVLVVSVILLLAACGSLLALIGVLEPVSTFNNPDGRLAYNYLLTFTNSQIIINGGSFIRAAGFFDEPGTLAFFSFYAVMVNELYLKKKNFTVLIVVTTIMSTWSLAFIIIICLYFTFVSCRKRSGLIALSLTVLFLFLAFSYLKTDSNPLSKRILRLTFDRVTISDEGTLQGDNRSHLLFKATEVFSNNPLLGTGRKDKNANGYSGANIMAPFARDGIIGGIMYYALYYLLIAIIVFNMLVNRDIFSYKEVVLVLLLGFNLFQRPNLDAGFETISMLIVISIFLQKNQILLSSRKSNERT